MCAGNLVAPKDDPFGGTDGDKKDGTQWGWIGDSMGHGRLLLVNNSVLQIWDYLRGRTRPLYASQSCMRLNGYGYVASVGRDLEAICKHG